MRFSTLMKRSSNLKKMRRKIGKKKANPSVIRNAFNQIRTYVSAFIDSPTKKIARENFHVKTTNLNLTFFETLMYYICNCKDLKMKKELIKRGKRAICKRIDISFIIQKLVEIEKIKVLLLDSNQLKLFEYIPKPILTNNRLKKLFSNKVFLNRVANNIEPGAIGSNYFQEQWTHINKSNSKKYIAEKINLLAKSYETLVKKTNPTELDVKLLNLLDEDVKDLLEQREKNKEGTVLGEIEKENGGDGNTNLSVFQNLEEIKIKTNSLDMSKENLKGNCLNKSIIENSENEDKDEEKKNYSSNYPTMLIPQSTNLFNFNLKEELTDNKKNNENENISERKITKEFSKLSSNFKFLTNEMKTKEIDFQENNK